MTDLEKAAQEWSNDNKNLFVCTATYHSCVNAFMAGASWQANQWRCETCKHKRTDDTYRDIYCDALHQDVMTDEQVGACWFWRSGDFGCNLWKPKEE